MRALPCFLVVAVACGNDTGAPSDTLSVDAPGAPLGPLMPQEVLGSGGTAATIASPTVVPVTYQTDPNGSDILAFFPALAQSSAWSLQTSEYGIGALTVGSAQFLSFPVASSDTEMRTIITTNLSNQAWGSASEDTVYAITLPTGTPFVDNHGTNGFCGSYHDDFAVGGVDIAYSMEVPCASPPAGVTVLQALTAGLSAALVDSVTDPRFENAPGYSGVDAPHAAWTFATGGEIAELCALTDTALWTDVPDLTYAIQRTYSNAAAHAGTDPCIGSAEPTYYQTVPEQAGSATITLGGSDVATAATTVAVGDTGTITAQISATAGAGPFTVTAIDVASAVFGASQPLLTFSQPTGTFATGATVTIPVTVGGKDASLGGNGAEAFEIATKPAHGDGPTTYFYGLVAQ